MRLHVPFLLVGLSGCGSFEGEYTLTSFDPEEGSSEPSFDAESGTMSIGEDRMGTLDVELPLSGSSSSTWRFSCAFEVPEEEQTNFSPDCAVEVAGSDGLLDAGTYPADGVAYLNTTGDGTNTNVYFTPADDGLLALHGFFRFAEK